MKKSSVEILAGIFVLIGIFCLTYLTIRLGKMEWLGEDTYPLYARFRSVSGLKSGTQVEIAGVPIGRVDSIELERDRMVAVVKLQIEKGVVLSEDSIASVKTAGLIGDKYVKLSPGGSERILKPGEFITETESAIDLEEILRKYVFGKI